MTSVKVYTTQTLTPAQQHHKDVAMLLHAARRQRTQECQKCAKKYAHKDHQC